MRTSNFWLRFDFTNRNLVPFRYGIPSREEKRAVHARYDLTAHITEIMCCMDDIKVEIMYMEENKKKKEKEATLAELVYPNVIKWGDFMSRRQAPETPHWFTPVTKSFYVAILLVSNDICSII